VPEKGTSSSVRSGRPAILPSAAIAPGLSPALNSQTARAGRREQGRKTVKQDRWGQEE